MILYILGCVLLINTNDIENLIAWKLEEMQKETDRETKKEGKMVEEIKIDLLIKQS